MSPIVTASSDKLPLRDKLAYTSGVFLHQPGLHIVNALALPVYNVLLGLNPAYIGYALAAFRIWDAMIDPLMGYISDRFDSRWGRRKPFMLVGAILCAVIFPLVWWASPNWDTGTTLAYFVGLNLLYFTALTLYAVPYEAFGYELTPDYDQRASLYAIRGWVGIIGFMGLGWVFPLTQRGWFASPMRGVHVVTQLVGLFFLLTALVPVWFLRERRAGVATGGAAPARKSPEPGLLRSVAQTLRNRAYLRIVLVGCAIVVGTTMVGSLSFYINVYYVFPGNVKDGSLLDSSVSTIAILLTLAAIPFLPKLSHRFGKGPATMGCMALQLLGSALKWFCYTPAHPWLQLIPSACVTIGGFGFWTLIPSMVADACDLDEYNTGERCEGMYASVTQWINKVGYSAANILSGLVLVWVGFDVHLGGAQSASTLFWMRVVFVAVPASAFVAGLALLWRYPLSRARLSEIRVELERRRGVVA